MKWISIKNKLPAIIGSYLVFLKNGYICMAFYNSEKKWCEMWSQQYLDVTHWSFLLKPPKDIK